MKGDSENVGEMEDTPTETYQSLQHIVFGRCNLTALSPTSFVMSYGPSHRSVSFLEACVTFKLSAESQTLSPI